MLTLYNDALRMLDAGRRFALAQVIYSSGSTPQKAGAMALFEAAGPVHGTLGGGCLEAEARARALRSLDEGRPIVFGLKLDEVDGWDDGLVCGGRVRIFVNPDIRGNSVAYRAALEAHARQEPGLLLTVVHDTAHTPGTTCWVPEATIPETQVSCDPRELRRALAAEKYVLLRDTNGAEIFVEPVAPAPRLIIAGAGHIGKALSHLGRLLGFNVTVIDDRAMFANPENLPDAHQVICGDIADTLTGLPLDPRSYVVIVTRGHQHDGQALAACIHAPVAYLGLIGSKRKSLLLRRRLLDEGLATEEEVARVVTPMGLDIGGSSVQEIALSIAAQLVAVRRKRTLDGAPLALPLTV